MCNLAHLGLVILMMLQTPMHRASEQWKEIYIDNTTEKSVFPAFFYIDNFTHF